MNQSAMTKQRNRVERDAKKKIAKPDWSLSNVSVLRTRHWSEKSRILTIGFIAGVMSLIYKTKTYTARCLS